MSKGSIDFDVVVRDGRIGFLAKRGSDAHADSFDLSDELAIAAALRERLSAKFPDDGPCRNCGEQHRRDGVIVFPCPSCGEHTGMPSNVIDMLGEGATVTCPACAAEFPLPPEDRRTFSENPKMDRDSLIALLPTVLPHLVGARLRLSLSAEWEFPDDGHGRDRCDGGPPPGGLVVSDAPEASMTVGRFIEKLRDEKVKLLVEQPHGVR